MKTNKERIGVVTYHRALNYGAVLQSYALLFTLSRIGDESSAMLIDYRCPYIEQFYKVFKSNPFKRPISFLKELLYYPFVCLKRLKFCSFLRRNINISKKIKVRNITEIDKLFDRLIVGSDQVWNTHWNGNDRMYFLSYSKLPKHSYAASLGSTKFTKDETSLLYKELSQFLTISVREKSTVNFLTEIGLSNIDVQLDPTLLVSQREWLRIARPPKQRDYVLLYTLEKSVLLENKARELARKHSTHVICIRDLFKRNGRYIYKSFISPEEFIGLFANAKFVLTNSFHGLMFSFIFRKIFFVHLQQKQDAPNSRIIDFLDDFGLMNRILSDENIPSESINYTLSDEIFERKFSHSIEYLRRIVK